MCNNNVIVAGKPLRKKRNFVVTFIVVLFWGNSGKQIEKVFRLCTMRQITYFLDYMQFERVSFKIIQSITNYIDICYGKVIKIFVP